jgi:hypothetical protein
MTVIQHRPFNITLGHDFAATLEIEHMSLVTLQSKRRQILQSLKSSVGT